MWDGPVRTYHRDGRVYRQGFFLGGLGEAVRGVPAAETAARTYRRRSHYGAVLFGLGFACSLVAIPIAITTRDDSEVNQTATYLTSAACLAGAIGGLIVALSGQPYHEDAINIFNDSLPPDVPIRLPGQPRGNKPLEGRTPPE